MGKTAFLYPGQGSQRVGMGADILESRPEVMGGFFDAAQGASGLEIRTRAWRGRSRS